MEPDKNFFDVLQKNNAQFQKFEERPWGSFQPGVTLNGGQSYFIAADVYGFGFSVEYAACESLLKLMLTGNCSDIENWMGKELFMQLQDVLKNRHKLPDTTNLTS